jgi:hypothetical protein
MAAAASSLCQNRVTLSALALLLFVTATMAWQGGPTYVSTFCGGVLFHPMLAFSGSESIDRIVNILSHTHKPLSSLSSSPWTKQIYSTMPIWVRTGFLKCKFRPTTVPCNGRRR